MSLLASSDTAPGGRLIPSAIAQRAVEWLVELQSPPVPDAVRREWQQWRSADPLHEQAWQRIEAMNDRFAELASPSTASVAQATLAPRGSLRRRQIVKTLAVAFFAGGAAWTAHQRTPWREWTADARTAIGERRTLRLQDGTRIVLNTGSAIDIRYDARERRLRLITGEVLVDSGKDALGRPLLVETAQGEATALGTRFVVRTGDNETRASVFDGAVRLQPGLADDTAVVLRAGEQSSFSRIAIAPPQTVKEDNATAWLDGMLVARDMRLADFLTELGRYSAHPLSCDPAVQDLRVSGTYPVADIDKVLDTVAALHALEVQTVTRFWGHQVVRIGLAPKNKSASG